MSSSGFDPSWHPRTTAAATPSVEDTEAPPLPGKLPPLVVESGHDRWIWGTFAAIVIVGFFLMTHRYWQPANGGPDQNGYLVGGKNFARSFSTGFKPVSSYAFVGREWIEARGRYFPKYPLGLSVIYAITLKLGSVPITFLVNPVAMTLALLGTFLLVREIVGSFYSLLALLLVATSPVCIGLTNTPSSHATAICFVAWGFYLLTLWWQKNGFGRAVGAGLLIGSAVTIRYTEGMLILPVVIVAALNIRKSSRRSWAECAALLFAWAIPVGLLAGYNWVTMHHFTGYDTTNESTGFSLAGIQENWEIMLRELYNTGLFFTLPITLLGAVMMWRWNWRVSLVISAWMLPNLVLYTSYYWAPDGTGIGYLRFVLTVFPALALTTVFGLRWIAEHAVAPNGRRPALPLITMGIIIAVGCAVNLNTALAASETESSNDRNLINAHAELVKHVPAGSMLFSVEQQLNYLQLVSDYELVDLEQFDARRVEQYANVDPNAVTSGLQAQRAMEIYNRVKDLPEGQMNRELVRQQNELMSQAIASGKRVFFALPVSRRGEVNRLLTHNLFSSVIVTSWEDPGDTRSDKKPHWLGVKGVAAEPARRATIWQLIEVKAAIPPPPKVVKPKPVIRPLSADEILNHLPKDIEAALSGALPTSQAGKSR